MHICIHILLTGTQDTEESGHEDGGHDQMGGDEPLREQVLEYVF